MPMEWSGQDQRKKGLGIGRMLLALVLAAFLGGALGLVWHASGLGAPDAAESAESTTAQ